MLLRRHLGVKGNIVKLLAEKDPKTSKFFELVKEIFAEAESQKLLKAKAVYQFFPAASEGNSVSVYDPDGSGKIKETFSFPRQTAASHLCLADYVRPADGESMPEDHIGFFVVTTGLGVREAAETLKDQGEYLRSHILHALSLELAEAFAEKIHGAMRAMWGFPDPPELTMQDRFAGHYRGIRISPGYPAAPGLEEQTKLFRLLNPEEIGVNLTEDFMMEPEASVSAFIFSHPQARYFNI